jgi:uncharacterized protein (TIGR04255 family)
VDEVHARWGGPATITVVSPSYSNPPVIETSLAVQFAPFSEWNVSLLGAFGERIASRYPQFNAAAAVVLKGKLPFSLSAGAVPRVRGLYVNGAAGRLVQVQDDMFAVNWQRKHSSDEQYPRYASLRQTFVEELDGYFRFLRDRGISSPTITGCQVTYINVVDPSSGLSYADVWNLMASPTRRDLTDPFHLTSLNVTAMFAEESVELTYSVTPALRMHDNASVIQFNLVSAESQVEASGNDLLTKMDRAHDLLIRAFEGMTSDLAKEVWGRIT